jgi:hypothetical protein
MPPVHYDVATKKRCRSRHLGQQIVNQIISRIVGTVTIVATMNEDAPGDNTIQLRRAFLFLLRQCHLLTITQMEGEEEKIGGGVIVVGHHGSRCDIWVDRERGRER